MKLNRYKLAKQALNTVLTLVEEKNLPILKHDVLNAIPILAVLAKDYKATLNYRVSAHAVKDSVININVKKKILKEKQTKARFGI